MTLEIGPRAPAFTLLDRAPERVTLNSYPTKSLVLAFYALAFGGG